MRKLKFTSEGGRGREVEADWEGILANVARRWRESSSDAVRQDLESYMVEQPCPTCQGRRLKPESLSVKLAGRSIGDIVELSVDDTVAFFKSIPDRSGRGRCG